MSGHGGAAGWGPLEFAPVSVHVPFVSYPGGQYRYEPVEERREALGAALAGVELGAHDQRVLDWLARGELPTVATVVSLILRACHAAHQAAASGGAR